MLLEDQLQNVITDMKNLTRLENIASDMKKKKVNDDQFHKLVIDARENLRIYRFAEDRLGFELDETERNTLKDYVQNLRKCVGNDFVIDEDQLNRRKNEARQISKRFKEKWKVFYDLKVNGYNSSLNMLDDLGYSDVAAIRNSLAAGKNWDTLGQPYNAGIRENIQALYSGIEKANAKVDQLNLNAEVRTFLRAVSSNTASIKMLTPNVLDWIDKQGIAFKFSIRFKK